jgi:hypothetical protein
MSSADDLQRRVRRMLHEAAGVLVDKKTVKRVWFDPERAELRAKMLAGDLSLAEIDERYAATDPLHGEADRGAALAHSA